MERFGKHYHTSDKNIVVEIPFSDEYYKTDIGSFIYVKSEYVDNLNDSPLRELINRGKLLLVDEDLTIEMKLFNRIQYLKDDLNNPIKYNKYQFYRKLVQSNDRDKNENDCLDFSEYLTTSIHNKLDLVNPSLSLLPYRYDVITLQAKHLPEHDENNIFGDTDEQNIDIVNSIDNNYKNHNANPDQGENYAIVTTEQFTQEEEEEFYDVNGRSTVITPYHVANVIYKIGKINITMEAAEGSHANIKSHYPKICMYSTNNNKYNFHKIWSKTYEKYNIKQNGRSLKMETIVLQSRDKNKILNEIYALSSNKRKRDDSIVYTMNKKRGGNKKTKKNPPVKKNNSKTKSANKKKTTSKKKE
tara:strand:+ start:647 stop:1720 length:1074 start_codon:yes stop_codon:yes gene_type:complete